MDEQPDVRETRRDPRFIVTGNVSGFFGGIDVRLRDVARRGLQIEHAAPLKPGARARTGFRAGTTATSFAAVVVWSRLSTTAGENGKLLYRSGLKLDQDEDLQPLLDALRTGLLITADPESLDRKRRKIASRAATKQPAIKFLPQVFVAPDQLLLIQQARDRLRSRPEEAIKWYNRGRYAMAEHHARLQDIEVSYREEVFAIWEYLERSLDLVTIARALQK